MLRWLSKILIWLEGKLAGYQGPRRMKRAHKAREAMIDAKNIENLGTDAVDQCEGLSTS